MHSKMQLRQPVDTGGQLDSSYAFHYLWLNWRILGIHAPESHQRAYAFYSAFIKVFGGFCFPVSQLVNLPKIRGLEQLIAGLSITMTVTMASLKHFTIFFNREALLKANSYLKLLDARCNAYTKDRAHILHAIRLCHLFYLCNTILFGFVTVGFAYIGMRSHRLVYNGWFPKFFVSEEVNFRLASAYENLVVFFFILQNVNNDSYPQCYLAVMIAHLRALSNRIARIGKDTEMSEEDNLQELVACIKDHKKILSYFDCIRPVISRTILLQFLITAVVLCLTAVNFMAFDRDVAHLLVTGTYLFNVSFESFPCCWFVNSLMTESALLTTAMYNCSWYDQNQKFRKNLIIFMQRSQVIPTIVAGNLAPVTLQTFVAMVKFSFSMFTILSQM